MKASFIASLALGAVTVSANDYTTSTVYTTSVYTVTSCAPTVTDCPAKMGSVTTDIISLYTTVCPVTETMTLPPPTSTSAPPPPPPMTTSTVKITKEYTITACPATVTNCPVGSKTSTIITSTTICPVTSVTPPPVKTDSYMPPPPPVKTDSALPPPPKKTDSTITYPACVPSTVTSIITVYPPTSVPAGPSSAPVCPGGAGCPPVVTSAPYVCPGCPKTTLYTPVGTGSPTSPAKNTTQTYVPVTGAASAQKAGGLFVIVGALIAALL